MSDFNLISTNLDIDPLYIDCDFSYDTRTEIIKFSIQFVYLIFGILLNLKVLSTILWKHRAVYMTNSFFILFSVDCMINTSILITEGILPRFFIYFTPVCPLLSDYFSTPLIGFKVIMILNHHAIICKFLMQSFLVLNRMTCVVFPVNHDSMWKKNLKFIIAFTILIPFTVDWNLAISRVYMQSTYGGFWLNYIKKVSWASQSRFQLIFIIIAMFFTVVCTSITLLNLPEQSKEIEKSITNATIVNSIGFTLEFLFQIYYSFFFSYTDASSPVYGFSFLTLDFLIIGSPIVMLCLSKSLRKDTYSWKTGRNEHISKILARTSGIIVTR